MPSRFASKLQYSSAKDVNIQLPPLILVTPITLPFKSAGDRKSTRLNSSHLVISYSVFCLKIKITGIYQFFSCLYYIPLSSFIHTPLFPTLFPYTTLFRSLDCARIHHQERET